MSGSVQVIPSLRINSTDSELSSAEPPVTRIPFNIFWQLYLYLRKEFTWLMWNFLITVAVQRFPCCNVLNPVLHLCNSCINSMTGTFIAITYYPNLWVPTESTLLLKASKSLRSVQNLENYWTKEQNKCNYLPFSCTASGPPESPWHESLPWPPAQMWNLHKWLLYFIIFWSQMYYALIFPE